MSRNAYTKCQVEFLSFFFYGYPNKNFSINLTSCREGTWNLDMEDAGTAARVRKTRGIRIDYWKLLDIQIPRSQRRKKAAKSRTGQNNTLYPVAVLPERCTDNLLLIHYIGYGSECDEWRQPEDLVQLESPCVTSEEHDFHQDLALKIKSLLVGHRKSNPVSRIEMTFDKVTFDEGLRTKGRATKSVRGTQH